MIKFRTYFNEWCHMNIQFGTVEFVNIHQLDELSSSKMDPSFTITPGTNKKIELTEL